MNRYHTLFGVGTVALFAYAIALQSPGAFAAVLAWLFGTILGYSMHKIVMLDVMADNEVMRTLLEDRTEELHWESIKRNLAEERLHRVMEMDNATK
jgi:hypothetical protein